MSRNPPRIEPGQLLTILVDLEISYQIPRDAQFKLTTTTGSVFVSTIVMGSSKC